MLIEARGQTQTKSSNPSSKNLPKRLDKADGIQVTRIATLHEARAVMPEWAEFADTAGSRNPFVHPDWLMPWAEHFLRPGEQVWLLMARRRGRLVGVAPFYRCSRVRGIAHSMQLWGTGRHCNLIELPQLLLDGEQPRAVARALVAGLCSEVRAWDWAMLPLEDQLWLEPDWLPKDATVTVLSNTVRPSVVLSISKDRPPTLKRNLRESLRRARNRLERAYPHGWSVSCATDRAELLTALPDLAKLHADRSRLPGKKRHPNVLRRDADRSFLSAAVTAAAEHDGVALYRLLIHSQAVAALLVLRTPDCTYFSVSGMSRDAWRFSPTTLLQGRAIDDAVALGHSWVNLSTGPDTAKLRWSEQLAVNPEFALVPDRPFSRMAFGAYWQASAAVAVMRERHRHRVLPDSSGRATGPARSSDQRQSR